MKSLVLQILNWTDISTVLIVAGVFALILQSWIAFFLTAGVMVFLYVRNPKVRIRKDRHW